jgi:hypothetical protein
LIPLYIGYAALQAADAHSTLRAIKAGAREKNPILRDIAHRPVILIPLKVGTSIATVYLVKRLRKTNPMAATTLMVSLNVAYALIVQHNYRVNTSR